MRAGCLFFFFSFFLRHIIGSQHDIWALRRSRIANEDQKVFGLPAAPPLMLGGISSFFDTSRPGGLLR